MSNRSPWHGLYCTAWWRRRRLMQLREHPLCCFCLGQGRVEAASVVDHLEPHRGNVNLFMTGPLQSLCKLCHDSRKQQVETYGYADDVGVDGAPIDPRHPWNNVSACRVSGRKMSGCLAE